MSAMPRRKGPPAALHIDTPAHSSNIAIVVADSSASTLSSAASDDISPRPRSLRNMKNLSLNLPSAQSSSNSLLIPEVSSSALVKPERRRRPSVISLPSTANPTTSALLHRKEVEGEAAVPYAEGPTQILPGIWLGSEDNARDWKGLLERGIKSILNVAKEVASPFDSATRSHPLRSTVSTPDLHKRSHDDSLTYYPPHPASGRPGMHYLKLQWSHGQQDLVETGFPAAMTFTDAAIERGEGVLIHCQCGISRSATLVIALVMRAAAERSPSVPSEIWALKDYHGAYTYVKEKSKWIGPNMSLIYQLLDYERKLKGGGAGGSPSASDRSSAITDEDEEWSRKRRLLDEVPSDTEDDEGEHALVMQEAKALDKAMEDRIVARKSSISSVASSTGMGMGAAWRSRFGHRKRTPSVASNMTNGSVLSEDLMEEDEEQEPFDIASEFESDQASSMEKDLSSRNSPEDATPGPRPPMKVRPLSRPPPSAPIWKTSFNIPPPPASATRSTFDLGPPPSRSKRRPAPLGFLPPVPSSPVQIVINGSEDSSPASSVSSTKRKSEPNSPTPPVRARTESRKPAPPPLHLRNSVLKKANKQQQQPNSALSTPSQTLFVFPPSPTNARTPSTMTLTSNINGPVPFPSLSTPRISTFRAHGRTRSFIGLGVPPTPTTAFSKVDARGYVGIE